MVINMRPSPDCENKISWFALAFSNQEASIFPFVQHHSLCFLSRHVAMEPSDWKKHACYNVEPLYCNNVRQTCTVKPATHRVLAFLTSEKSQKDKIIF